MCVCVCVCVCVCLINLSSSLQSSYCYVETGKILVTIIIIIYAIYGQKPSKMFVSGTGLLISTKLGMKHR